MPVFVGAGHSSFMKDTDGIGMSSQTTTEINNMTGMVAGQIVFDETVGAVKFYNGTSWLKISAAIPTISSISGNILDGVGTTITLTGTNFLQSNLIVNFLQSSDNINVNVTVTPTNSTSANVTVPASVYNNVTAGNVVTIKVTNSDNVDSNNFNTTAVNPPSGGTKTTSGGYTYHTFTASGNFTNTINNLSAEYLLVGGGGSGGPGTAGGGGAGGVLQTSGTLSAQVYSIVIGGGGAGNVTPNTAHNSGNPSTGFGETAVGGGRGAGTQNGGSFPAGNGGSGGGGAAYPGAPIQPAGAGTSGQGNPGGVVPSTSNQCGGGGGGAGGPGLNGGAGPSEKAGDGGPGTNTYSAWHTATSTGSGGYIAGGGGGGNGTPAPTPVGGAGGGGAGSRNTSTGGNGATNTGSGGGGSWNYTSSPYGSGGSGLVIVRYQL